jgi:uncharacterized repeat protein (TIGR03803 family)
MNDIRSPNQTRFPSKPSPLSGTAGTAARYLLPIAATLLAAFSLRAATFNVLYTFPTNSDPSSTLVEGKDGVYYGTTLTDGTEGYGSVFRVTADGVFSNLFSFSYTNGAFPASPLLFGDDGALYGATRGGGPGGWCGAVFRMSTNGSLTTLASFAGPDGANPLALVQGRDGAFYGTTISGGAYTNRSIYGDGTVFRVTTNGLLTSLASFAGTNGWAPYAGLVQGRDGALYGTTVYGGPYTNENADGYGTAFKVTTNGVLTTLVLFAGTNGAHPSAPLVEGRDGMFYGTAESGAAGWGSVYRVSPTGTLTTLVNFDRNTTGVCPIAGLVEGHDGAFYGVTSQGAFAPDRHGGTLFRVTTNGLLSGIYSFAEAEGRWPDMALLQGSDGAFYGTCIYGGGPQNGGTLFRLDLATQLFPLKTLASGLEISFSGLPATSYSVLRATNPSGPWSIMSTVAADTNGIATWVDPLPPPDQAFYRTAIPQVNLTAPASLIVRPKSSQAVKSSTGRQNPRSDQRNPLPASNF